MIDFSKYALQELQAVVEVLDWLTDDMSCISDEMCMPLAIAYYGAARACEGCLVKQQAEQAAAQDEQSNSHELTVPVIPKKPVKLEPQDWRKFEEQYTNHVASEDSPSSPPPADLQALVDTLSRCSDKLVALALAEERNFAECRRTDVFNRVITLRNANRSIIDLLFDIRGHYNGLH